MSVLPNLIGIEIFRLPPKGTGAKSVAIVTSYYVPCCTFLKGYQGCQV